MDNEICLQTSFTGSENEILTSDSILISNVPNFCRMNGPYSKSRVYFRSNCKVCNFALMNVSGIVQRRETDMVGH